MRSGAPVVLPLTDRRHAAIPCWPIGSGQCPRGAPFPYTTTRMAPLASSACKPVSSPATTSSSWNAGPFACRGLGPAACRGAIRHQQTLSNAILDTIDALVVVLDRDGHLTWINRAAQQSTGYSPTEICGRSFVATVLPKKNWHRNGGVSPWRGSWIARDRNSLVKKEGPRRPGSLELPRRSPADGSIQSIVLTGTMVPARRSRRRSPPRFPGRSRAGLFACTQWPVGKEDAKSPRRTFRFRQSIAPMEGSSLPTPNQFFEVNCKNISAGGISFFLPRKPDFTSLVVALGRPPGVTYFTASVVRLLEQQRNGKAAYMVGCRFIGRVHL